MSPQMCSISDTSTFAMYRNLKFLHMENFSPHVSHLNYVTNIRYASADCCKLGLASGAGVNLAASSE